MEVAAAAPESVRFVVMFSRSQGPRADRPDADAAPVLDEMRAFFTERLRSFAAAGIARERLVFDPGMGFFLGRAAAPSLRVLKHLAELHAFGVPLLVSVSRKSFLGEGDGPACCRTRPCEPRRGALGAAQRCFVRAHARRRGVARCVDRGAGDSERLVIPLRDSIPASRTPVVTWALVAACSVAFLLQLGDDQGQLIEQYGMVPARVFDPQASHVMRDLVNHRGGYHRLMPAAVPDWLTLLTCTFLHGGWLHFLGNMWFLWIFGDNVEDRFGRLRFLCFYLGCGVAASLAHLLTSRQSGVPTIGASGAIAGVMGAYLFCIRVRASRCCSSGVSSST
jgi:membrane associated rhomboid family serine protease